MQLSRISFEYKLKHVTGIAAGNGNYGFGMEKSFIPVETALIDKAINFGTHNGQSIGFKNLMPFFDRFENIPVLAQNMQNVDLSEYLLSPGLFIPEPGLAVDLNTHHYVMFYLEKI